MKGSVRKKGKSWYYSFEGAKINGKRTRHERFGGYTKSEALDSLRKALNEFDQSGKTFDFSDMSVHDYFNYWYEQYVMKNLKYNTQENYRMIIDNHILPYIGIYKLKSIDPASIQKLIDSEFEKGFSKRTLEITRSVLSGAFKKAVYPYKLIKESPVKYIEMPFYDQRNKKTKDALKVITLEDFDKLLAFYPEGHPFHVPMMIAFQTGMRRGEVCGLTWNDVDFDEGTLTIEKTMIMEKTDYFIGTPKTQSSYRTIGIGDSLLKLLRTHRKEQMKNKLFYGRHYEDTNFVCTKENGSPITPNVVKWHCNLAKRETGVDFSFHSFRHTHATLLLENGAKDKAIQERLGHSRIATTMDTYSHLTVKTKKETVDIFENLMKNN
ncbi:tyrosine-type recombinase/integrase [Psychrobacillus psychrotolerans]|uniref:tyrosine-type recombinase/integrase n=1 Tax=Psychrobacillus psychrotolerans TaxID=126156 RepID=UPI003314D90C